MYDPVSNTMTPHPHTSIYLISNTTQIVRRLHQNLPQNFSSNIEDYQILGHNVGIRPSRSSGIRLEKDVISGQRIVHAYGKLHTFCFSLEIFTLPG